MASEYSYPILQTVAENGNILFFEGTRSCKKGNIYHRDASGVFRLKGSAGCGKAVYRVTFDGNIAVATGGTAGAISVSIAVDGEIVNNAVAIVTPAAVGDYFNVSVSTFVEIPCGCCATVSAANTSNGNAIDVTNANIIFDRIA